MATPLYHEAADVLHAVLNGRGLKDATYGSKLRHTKAVYALVAETLRHRRLLDSIALHGGLTAAAKAADIQDLSAVIVMAYELLMGEGKIKGGGKLKRTVVDNLESMQTSRKRLEKDIAAAVKLAEGQSKSAGTGDKEAPAFDPASAPRYIRVNRVKQTSLDSLWDSIGQSLLKPAVVGLEAPPLALADVCDQHIPGVLALPPGSAETAARHEKVQSGDIVLQDRSSCISAQALLSNNAHSVQAQAGAAAGSGGGNLDAIKAAFRHNALPEILQREVKMCLPTGKLESAFDVIDACAAPGNKTAHAAALLAASGLTPQTARVLAFDRSGKRLETLKRRMKQMSTEKWVVPTQADFLTVDPADPQYARVRAILLDPSCSGSGMVTRVDHGAQGGAGGGIMLPDVPAEDSIFEAAAAAARPKSKGLGRPGGRTGNHSNKRGAKRSREGKGSHQAQDVSALAAFQLAALCHALSFPQALRVAYSTCSIHAQENEAVVLAALARVNAGGKQQWRTVCALPSWPRRGAVPTVEQLPADASEAQALLGGTDAAPAAKRAATGSDSAHKGTVDAAAAAAAVGFLPEHVVCVNPFEGDTSGGFFQAVLERVP